MENTGLWTVIQVAHAFACTILQVSQTHLILGVMKAT